MARPRTFDESEAIERAMGVFWRKGFEATSICDLEEALDLGRQSIYNTFGDKRQLFLLALKRYDEAGTSFVEKAFDGEHRGLTAIQRYFEGLIAFQTASKERSGCFLTRSLVDHGTLDPDVAKRCQLNESLLRRKLIEALQQAIEDGSLDASFNVPTAAFQLSTHVYGLSVMARAGASQEDLLDSVRFMLSQLQS